MGLTSRQLPRAEWEKLALAELGQVYGLLDDRTVTVERTTMQVVEHRGRVVGNWGLLWLPHAEGIWVDPEYQYDSGVLRELTGSFKEMAAAKGVQRLVTASLHPAMDRLLTSKRVEATPIAGRHYSFDVNRLPDRQQEK